MEITINNSYITNTELYSFFVNCPEVRSILVQNPQLQLNELVRITIPNELECLTLLKISKLYLVLVQNEDPYVTMSFDKVKSEMLKQFSRYIDKHKDFIIGKL